jgi:hypothetical protein
VAAATVYHKGTINMEIDELGPGGSHYDLTIPASLVDLAINLVPERVIEDATRQVTDNLHHPGMEPESWIGAVDGIGEALLACPDTVFVEVKSPNEHVVVEKRDGSLVIRVLDRGQRVYVSVPMSTLVRAADKLAASF